MTELNDDYVSLELRKRIEYFKDLMAVGTACKDYIDYQNLVGQVRGIQFALDVISELKKKMEEEDNKT